MHVKVVYFEKEIKNRLGISYFSGGYVIHLAAGTSGFVAAAVIRSAPSG
jgi:ammonia channel protein AmtB